MVFIVLFGRLILLILIGDFNIINTSFINNNEIINIFFNNFDVENTTNLNKLYNFPTNLITLLLINYLLLTLIAVVKITDIFYGPLRPKI